MLTLFFWYGLIVVACATGDGHGLSQTQIGSYSSQQLHHKNINQQLDSHQFSSHTQEAEDRSLHHAYKYRMKRKKRKYKLFKKHFKKCGDDFNFKFIKRADDDPDTISIRLPHGFGDEYYPEGIQRKNPKDASDDNGLDDSDDDGGEELGEFTQKLMPVRSHQSFKPTHPRIPVVYKPNRLPPQRIFTRHKPWIPVPAWKASNSKEPMLGAFYHDGSLPPKLPAKTLETPLLERKHPMPNYVYQNAKFHKFDMEPKRRFSQPGFHKFYKTSAEVNESRNDEESVVTVTPIMPYYQDDSWMPVIADANKKYRKVFARTDEPEIITAKLDDPFMFKNHNRTVRH